MGKVDGTDETLEASPTATGSVGARPQAELHELSAGDTIGRYEIVGVLGSGGMGRVYRARDPDLNRELAIKVLRRAPGSGGSGGLEHRLLREAQAMARLKHANLATVYDVGTVRGEVFIAFELIDGQTLATWMRTPGRTTAEKLAALDAAGRGLEAAHSAGVIHRDFKPDNVLVAHDGEVKVVDFGLARGVDAGGGDAVAASPARGDALATDLTMTGSLLGTPAYMAPEQHKGIASDARADQFGFAVSAWEALYGERPFKGKSLETLAAAILGGAIEPPPAGADVPPHVEQALRRAMSVDPAARFADMDELLDALAASPARATASPARSAAPRRSREWKLAAIVIALALVGAGVFLFVTGGGKRRANRASYTNATEAEQVAIMQTIFRASADWKGCYLRAYHVDSSLGEATISIDFGIGRDGRVMDARVVDDGFRGKGGIAACIASKSTEWQFAPPESGNAVKVVFPFRLAPPESELPPPPPGPPPPPVPTVEGSIDRETIRASIRTQIEKVSDCYDNALTNDPLLGDGKVSIQFVIAGDGTVKKTDIAEDTFGGRGGVARCVASRTFEWSFPRPEGGGTVEVTYPFVFRPSERHDAP